MSLFVMWGSTPPRQRVVRPFGIPFTGKHYIVLLVCVTPAMHPPGLHCKAAHNCFSLWKGGTLNEGSDYRRIGHGGRQPSAGTSKAGHKRSIRWSVVSQPTVRRFVGAPFLALSIPTLAAVSPDAVVHLAGESIMGLWTAEKPKLKTVALIPLNCWLMPWLN